MKIEGSIRPAAGASFDRAAWRDLVGRRPELRRPAPREIINPFTRMTAPVRPTEDAAEIVLDGNVIGNAGWSMSDERLVNVSVEPAGLSLVQEWATELGGVFVADSDG